MNFFQMTPAAPEVSQIQTDNYDPSTSDFYKRKLVFDITCDQIILTEEQPCLYAVDDWVLVTYDGHS